MRRSRTPVPSSKLVTVRVGAAETLLRCGCHHLGTRYVDRSRCYIHGARQPYVRESGAVAEAPADVERWMDAVLAS